jgi:tRNA modification GTPase
VEQIGIRRTKDTAHKAELILYVADAADAGKPLNLPPEWKDKTIIVVYNKTDLHPLPEQKADNIVGISAKNGHIQPLLDKLQQRYSHEENTQATVITNARHYDALHRAEEAIAEVENGLQNNLSGELLALDLHDCINALGEITGQITSEEVLHSVFSRFCIGK